jgi:hypothetical protein
MKGKNGLRNKVKYTTAINLTADITPMGKVSTFKYKNDDALTVDAEIREK